MDTAKQGITCLVRHVEGCAPGQDVNAVGCLGANGHVLDVGMEPTVGLPVHGFGAQSGRQQEDLLLACITKGFPTIPNILDPT